jgi:tRNA A37 threonylcarbamoyladenosine dehydratase
MATTNPEHTDRPVPAVADQPAKADWARRFGGVGRLYGQKALARFARAHICVVGVGGVGSWTVEALARSAVGELTLIDLDHVSESNINRQIQAVDDSLGQAKVRALAERIARINPLCRVHEEEEFVTPQNVQRLLGQAQFDFVVDASDQVAAKVALVAFCKDRALPFITVGSAGGQRDATRVRIADLAHTEHEPLLARVRKRLRSTHGFSRNIKEKFGVAAVFSDEPIANPWTEVASDGSRALAAPVGLNCAGYGSSVAVTAVFGMVAAGYVLDQLAQRSEQPAPVEPSLALGAEPL